MALSSQLSAIKHEVFIGFSGTDTRHGFLSHLRKELRQKQIKAYVDHRFEREDKISPSLLRAIKESLISLIIFSKNYASSKACLEELVQIIECMEKQRQIVIPVFYNTDPSHVRHQKGSYEDALANHDEYYKEKVPIWRSALNKAANLSGFHYSSNYEDEAELIEEIAKSLSSKLNCMYKSEFTELVGIDERIADLESLIMDQRSKDVRVIGIWGMGGVGKTTIAAVVFNRFCPEFEGHCFLANVREQSKNYGIIRLKNEMFSILLKEDDLYIGTPNGITPYVKRRLLRKRVLVVLDDISDSDQLENLVGAQNCFGIGSRIIITTRDKQVLAKSVDEVYEVKPLIFDDAVQLFMLNAFENNNVDMEWIKLSRKVISYAKGIPLALKILGSFLHGKSKQEWESQLEKLKKMPYAKIQDVMRLSYDGLDREEKNIFLYIACFLKGYESQRIILLLNSCGFSTIIGLRVLRDKALITEVSNSGKSIILMHDLIQEMGWEIVLKESIDHPGNRSRLWDANDIYQVLKHNMGTTAIQSISLNVAKIEGLCLAPQVFSKMSELKLLKFSQYDFHEEILHLPQGLESLPNELRFFEWVCYPLKSLSSSFSPKSLVELKLTWSRVEKLWDGVLDLVNLKKIDLSSSKNLLELPDFSKAKNLEEVELSNCKSLRKVHASILSIHKLVKLDLSYCKSLTILRGDIHLRSLSNLSLSECSKLKQFSVTSENMKNLSLKGTSINELPSSMMRLLNKLETLYLDRCKNLKNLPNKFANFSSLRELRIIGCVQLDASNLHFLLEGSRSLETLLLQDCRNLFELPDNIRFLSTLKHLSLHESDIVKLPASIKHLQQLAKLNLSNCRRLHSLPELPPSIKELYATNCTSLKRVMVSSMASDQLREQIRVGFRFQNCVNLDDHSLRAIAMHSHVNIKRLAYENLSSLGKSDILGGPIDVIYPGSNVPEWFMKNRMRQSSVVTMDLSSASSSSPCVFVGFIFCVVVSRFPSNDKNFVGCDCYLEINGEKDMNMCAWTSIHTCEFMSDHVCIWYDERCCMKSESMEDGESKNLKILFEFFAQTGNTWEKKRDIVIKECGVCPIYNPEYHTFLEELKSKSQLRAIEEDKDEEEAIHLAQKSNQHIFPSQTTETWNNATQGLKDFINL